MALIKDFLIYIESEKVELHRGGAYRHPDTHENEGCSSRLQTPSLNGQQTRAQTNSCQKERTCESEANSGCGMGDLAISLKNFRESMKNSLADLTTTTTDLPDVNIGKYCININDYVYMDMQ